MTTERHHRFVQDWDDHLQARDHAIQVPWHVRDAASKDKVLRFLTERPVGRFGCGTARTVADYERYSGIDFTNWTGTPAAYAGDEPDPLP